MKKLAPAAALLLASARLLAAPEMILHDFGEVLEGTVVTHEFAVTNTGTKGLAVSSVNASCNCLKVERWQNELPPGQAGKVRVSFDTGHAGIGRLVRAVTLAFGGRQAPRMLLLRGEVWPAMECEPKLLRLAPIPGSNGLEGEISLTNHLDLPVEVLAVTAENPGLLVSLQTNLPGRSYRVLVSAHGIQEKLSVSRIRITTSACSNPVIPVEIYMPRTEHP